MGWKSLFWQSGGDTAKDGKKPDTGDPSDEDLEKLAAEAANAPSSGKPSGTRPTVTPLPASVPPAPPVEGSCIGRDFAAIYAETGTAGDPQADQLLVTHESLKSTTAPAAMTVVLDGMMRGIKANPAAIADTLKGRIRCLNDVIMTERQGMAQRAADRGGKLEAATAQVTQQIEAKRQEIADLEARLDTLQNNVQAQNAQEQGSLVDFEQNATAEVTRFQELLAVLPAPATEPAPKK